VFDPGLGQVRAGFLVSRLIAAFSNGKPDATLPENAEWIQFRALEGKLPAGRAKTSGAGNPSPRRLRDL
jgi:hypothetical protein